MKPRLKIIDVIIILFVASLTFFSAYMVYMRPLENSQVLIRGRSGEWIYPIEADVTVSVSGPAGDTIIRLHNQHAWIESSPCYNQNCVTAGRISRQGQWTACLPNSVLLLINGIEDINVDGLSW